MSKANHASFITRARLLLLCCLVAFIGCGENRYKIEPITISIDSLSQVILLKDSLVQPINYTHIQGLERKPVPQAKQLFIAIILPSILIAKFRLQALRQEVVTLQSEETWSAKDSTFYLELKDSYKASDLNNLLKRMQTIPNSIVLAQAAVESGWGQSRFFKEGNNVFGIWSYNRDEPRLQASAGREDGPIYVRAYDNISESIQDYFKTLGKARAYRQLRTALMETDDPYILLPYLRFYSERRLDYVHQLKTIIDQNDLTRFDSYQIDPQYLIAE